MAKLKSPDAGPESEPVESVAKAEAPVAVAASVGAGRSYSIQQRTDPDAAAVVVESADGTPEDAVRAFNARRGGEIRTAKQLILTPL